MILQKRPRLCSFCRIIFFWPFRMPFQALSKRLTDVIQNVIRVLKTY